MSAIPIWIRPGHSIVAAIVFVRLLFRIETVWNLTLGFAPDTARAVLGPMASSLFTVIMFVSSALFVVVQLASAQCTPRNMATVWSVLWLWLGVPTASWNWCRRRETLSPPEVDWSRASETDDLIEI